MNCRTLLLILTRRPIRLLLALVSLLIPGSLLTAQTAGTPRVALPDHVVKSLMNATLLPHTARMDEEPITLTVVLNLSDPAGAAALEEAISDPESPNYHQPIGVAEFTARFGPSQEGYDKVLAYLQDNGFTLYAGSPNRRTMTVRSTRAKAQGAFHVVIDDYQSGDRTFHAIASDPAVPETIAPLISSVFGLSNQARIVPAGSPSPATSMSIATAYNGTLTASGKTNTGGLPPGLNGSGQTIGLLEFDGFEFSDVSHWLIFAGLPSGLIKHLSVTNIDGGTSPSGCTQYQPQCGTSEVMLDIEAAMGVAQGAKIIVYSAPPTEDLAYSVNYAATEIGNGGGGVLSVSWAECEGDIAKSDATSLDSMISDLMAWGVTVFAASGDNGATCKDGTGTYSGAVAFPADAPHVVAVGGTTLNVGAGNTYGSESWWKNSGGFGVSQFTLKPGYQSSLYPAATGRSVPDVAMEAAPSVILCQATPTLSPDCGIGTKPGTTLVYGGTSLATPLFAAVWAISNQASTNAGGYAWSASNGYFYKHPGAFHAATSMTGTGNNFQHVGLGSPDITKLIAIANPPKIDSYSPDSGVAAGGTKVTIVGSGFIGVEKVTFGGVLGAHLTILSDTKLTVETPEAPLQEAPIKVVTPGGTATSAGPYVYYPEISGVSPASGPMEGGTTVTVTGRALTTHDLFFEFGFVKATSVSCPSATKCTMVSPAHAPGTVDVVADTVWGYGNSPLSAADHFKYESLTVSSITPLVGPTTGGLMIAITGTSLANGKTKVSFGGANATGVFCVGSTYCGMTSPPHAAGKVSVTVTVDGTTSVVAAQQFTFAVFPTVTGISPNVGNPGTVVTLTGTGFNATSGKTSFTFFGIPVPGTCSSTTQCTATVPIEAYGGTAQYTEVPVTVNELTSLDYVEFHYPKPFPPPPCKGTTCP